MSRNKITWIVILGALIVGSCVFLVYNNISYYKGTIEELKSKNSSLEKKVSDASLNGEKYRGLIGTYAMNIQGLHEGLSAPVFIGDDKVVLKEMYETIKADEIFVDTLIFRIGPVRRETNEIYYAECLVFEQINKDELLVNLDDFIPTDLLKQYTVKYQKINGSKQYEIIK